MGKPLRPRPLKGQNNMNKSDFRVAATDTAKLQSAWSAYDPDYYGVTETRAMDAFIDCVNQFVYFEKLCTPLPETNKGETNPFMDLWFANSEGPYSAY